MKNVYLMALMLFLVYSGTKQKCRKVCLKYKIYRFSKTPEEFRISGIHKDLKG